MSYTDPRYDARHTFRFPTTVDFGGGTGITGPGSRTNIFRMPYRAKLLKFGVISVGATNLNCSTTTSFILKTEGGTTLDTFTPGYTTIGQGEATAQAPTTATNIPKNQVVMPHIGVAAASGQVVFFMDYQELYDE